jgi:RimJ/RimL family protein N-acetyltransferase
VWTLRPCDRGLWDFVTLPNWRGHRIYPRLLQAIVQIEADAERFWIGCRADNEASMRGVRAAGFQLIGITAMTEAGEWVEVIRGDHDRAHANPMAADMRLIEADDSELTLGDVEGL